MLKVLLDMQRRRCWHCCWLCVCITGMKEAAAHVKSYILITL
jgi:hypothetical protein